MAGCAAKVPPANSCETVSCPITPTPTTTPILPTKPTGVPLPNLTMPNVQLLSCRQIRASMEVPLTSLRPVVPDAFDTLGFTTETGGILVWIHVCERTVNNSALLGGASFYQAFVFVYPKNESWTREGYVNYYLLDPVTDNAALQSFLASQGMPTKTAGFSSIQLAAGGVNQEHWEINAGSWKSEFDGAIRPTTNPQELTFRAHIWYGTGPFFRISYSDASDGDSSGPQGEFVASGDSQLARAIPGGAAAYIGGASGRADALYQFDGNWTVNT